MPKDTMNALAGARITERELLNLLLDSPVRNGPNSALFKEKYRQSFRSTLFKWLQSDCLDENLPTQFLDALCDTEDPSSNLLIAITDLEDWSISLRHLARELDALKDACSLDDSDALFTHAGAAVEHSLHRFERPVLFSLKQ